MAHYRLTDKQVQNAQPAKGKAKIKLQDGGGLTLVARAKDRKYWTLRVVIDGKMKELGLGSASGAYAVSLADARDKAHAIRSGLRNGVLPPMLTHGKGNGAAVPGALSFKQVAESYMRQHEPSWKSPIHARQWAQTLEDFAYPVIGGKAPGDVTTADVIAILKPIWNTMPETASRVRGRIESILAAWKVESGQQDRFNPATWKGHLDAVFPRKSKVKPVTHHPALPYAEAPALMARLSKANGMAALALRFLILTATRTSETLGARWREIEPKGQLALRPPRWSIPKERMKVGKPHVVPLSDTALAVLNEAARHRIDGNDAIFPGTKWVDDEHSIMSNMSILALLKRLQVEATAHGFRSSFRDWCADNGEDRELAEAALAHTIGGVEGAYRRTDMIERRAPLMQRWADYVTRQDAGDKVVQMRKAPAKARR